MNLPDNAFALKYENNIYIFIVDVPMKMNAKTEYEISLKNINYKQAIWLDDKTEIDINNDLFVVKPYMYGKSYYVKVAKIVIK